ncbi:Sigma factor binding protein 2 [Cardamine amara subsp. amara]|uniref:Sigma factor binding protein 2 n=1 Tax=Cardamine amara subsp. amara TaxID=228776 RepID=A0ABD1BSK0_CARAN
MDSTSTLLTSKSSPTRKQTKHKRKTTMNKAIKVRYISNPMRVETCASKFRELVQELTGQDAVDLPSEPTTFAAADPHQAEMNPAPSDGEIRDREYYSPLDEEVLFNAPPMSAGLSGFFSSGFYNVNNAVGSISSL